MKKNILFTLLLSLITLSLSARGGNGYAASNLFEGMTAGDKAAVLMVHFGTTHADTREKTIDVLNEKVKETFPNLAFREAYTSRIIIKRLGDRGIQKLNPNEALKALQADGYTHILVHSSNIIDGVEMESLNRNIQEFADSFKEIRVSTPLLYDPQDYEKVIEALTVDNDPTKAYVLVGHGTYHSSTAQYAMLDYMLNTKGYTNLFVGTIEGYPTLEDVVVRLKKANQKQVVLIPLMFVAGEHAKNDINEDWKEALQEEGFTVEVDMKGLGENPKIIELYLSHLQFVIDFKKMDIMDKKTIYQQTGKKIKTGN